jgi:hypothetical protein
MPCRIASRGLADVAFPPVSFTVDDVIANTISGGDTAFCIGFSCTQAALLMQQRGGERLRTFYHCEVVMTGIAVRATVREVRLERIVIVTIDGNEMMILGRQLVRDGLIVESLEPGAEVVVEGKYVTRFVIEKVALP